jgi:hypothetical protein
MDNEVQPQARRSSYRLSSKFLLVIVALFLMFVCGFLGYLLGSNKTTNINNRSSTKDNSESAPTNSFISDFEATPDPATSDWLTYADYTYGFFLKYPSEWKLNGDSLIPSPVVFTVINNDDPQRYPIQVFINVDEQNKMTVNQWFNFLKSDKSGVSITLPPKNIAIGDYSAISTREDPNFEDDLVVAPANSTPTAAYQIYISGNGEGDTNPYPENDPFAQKEISNFHMMLSTIRFTNK